MWHLSENVGPNGGTPAVHVVTCCPGIRQRVGAGSAGFSSMKTGTHHPQGYCAEI